MEMWVVVLLFSNEAEFRDEEGPACTFQWKEMEENFCLIPADS